jgi:hypothetical protein
LSEAGEKDRRCPPEMGRCRVVGRNDGEWSVVTELLDELEIDRPGDSFRAFFDGENSADTRGGSRSQSVAVTSSVQVSNHKSDVSLLLPSRLVGVPAIDTSLPLENAPLLLLRISHLVRGIAPMFSFALGG